MSIPAVRAPSLPMVVSSAFSSEGQPHVYIPVCVQAHRSFLFRVGFYTSLAVVTGRSMANMLYSSGDHTPPRRAPAAPALSPSQAEYANAATTTHRPTPASPISTSDPNLAARSARILAANLQTSSWHPLELVALARWLPSVPTCNNSHAFRFARPVSPSPRSEMQAATSAHVFNVGRWHRR